MKLGELIKEGRKKMGLTMDEAAERIKVSKMTYIRLEADKTRIIPFDNIISIANNLEIDFFKMLKAYGKDLINLDIKNASKVSRRLQYKSITISNAKLEKLIQENINNLRL